MSNEKLTENWTKFPNFLLYNLESISENELKILSLLIRKTIYSKPSRKFLISYMDELDIPTKGLIKAIDSLIEKDLIKQGGVTERGMRVYDIWYSNKEEVYEEEFSNYNFSKKEKVCSFVYLMKNLRNGYTKIGLSKNPQKREKTLQSEEPEIEILFYNKGFYEDEKFLHNHFDNKRLRGEWFDLNEEDVKFIEKYLFLCEKSINEGTYYE
jgi:hypothetical protein